MKSLKIVLLLALALLSGISAHAQDQTFTPFERLFFVRAFVPEEQYARWITDIYSWQPGEETPHPETSTGWANEPVVSPDGSKVVYTATTESIAELLDSDGEYPYGAAPYPTDIWLIDTSKPLDDPARHTQIADQITGLPDADSEFQIRSTPVWSPDSTRLAWTELHNYSTMFAGRIVVYDLRTGETTQIAAPVSLGYADGGEWSVRELRGWGDGILHYTSNAGMHPENPDNAFGENLQVFDETGIIAEEVVTYWGEFTNRFMEAEWVRHGDRWLVVLRYSVSGDVLFDPRTGTYAQSENPPVFESVLGRGAGADLSPREGLRFRTFDPSGAPIFYDVETRQLVYWDTEIIPVLPGEHDESWNDYSARWVPAVWTLSGETTPIERP